MHNPIGSFKMIKGDSIIPHPKTLRGWAPLYDVIFNNIFDQIDVITEIGIGNATCQIAWSKTFPGKKVVGIDIASTSLELASNNNLDVKQYINSMQSITTVHSLTMEEIYPLNLYYNKDAYSEEVANDYLKIYGKQIFFINDGRQDGICHKHFKQLWAPLLKPGGLLLQERFARFEYKGIRVNQMKKAIANGWLVYDCREYVQFENPNSNGFLGIWTEEKDHWKRILQDFKLITDPYAQIEKSCLLLDDAN